MKIVTILLAVLALGAGGWYWTRHAQPAAATTADHSSVERPTTSSAEARDIRFTVSAAGEIVPAEQVSVKPEINGRISQLLVDVGDVVKKGQLLLSLDDRDLQTEKESKDKEIERARVQMDQAERTFLRNKKLYEDKVISLEIFEDFRTQFELSKNSLSQAEKSREQVLDRLRKTEIMAPFDCTVLTRPVSVGQAVSGSAGFNSGTEVLTIADLNQLIINAHINQADITRLKVQQEVEVLVEAVSGLKLRGVVDRIAPQATIKNNIKGFAARIALKNVDPRVRPSMTANIRIPVASADDVLSVPLASVFTELNDQTQQMERFVYVKSENGFERRLVNIGVSDYFFAEVQSGLTAGDIVALEEPKEEAEKRNKARGTKPAAVGATQAPAAPAATPASGTKPATTTTPRPASNTSTTGASATQRPAATRAGS